MFLDHLGVPSTSLGYGSGNGIYHSLYDTFHYFQRYGDPGYRYGVAQADMVGRMLMRLASADVLPFDYATAAEAIGNYVGELVDMEESYRLSDELRAMAASTAELHVAGTQANTVYRGVIAGGDSWVESNRETLAEVNRLIMRAERELIDERGIWRRPWYRSVIYAPGYYEGYAAKTLPGVREAMEEGEWEIAKTQAVILNQALRRAAAVVLEAAEKARTIVPKEVS